MWTDLNEKRFLVIQKAKLPVSPTKDFYYDIVAKQKKTILMLGKNFLEVYDNY